MKNTSIFTLKNILLLINNKDEKYSNLKNDLIDQHANE